MTFNRKEYLKAYVKDPNNKKRDACRHMKYYGGNKDKIVDRHERRRKERTEWFKTYKATLHCAKCDCNHPAALEFHHTDPSKKEYTISVMYLNLSMKRIMEEIEKMPDLMFELS